MVRMSLVHFLNQQDAQHVHVPDGVPEQLRDLRVPRLCHRQQHGEVHVAQPPRQARVRGRDAAPVLAQAEVEQPREPGRAGGVLRLRNCTCNWDSRDCG